MQLGIGELSRVLVFWSSKMHPSLLQAHIVCLFCLFEVSESAQWLCSAKNESLDCGLKCGFKMSSQSYRLFFPSLQFSHLRFCSSEFRDCPKSCLSFFQDVSRTCTWKNVRLWIISFMFLSVRKGCTVSMPTEINKRASIVCLQIAMNPVETIMASFFFSFLSFHSSAAPCHLRDCAIENCETVKSLIFWSSKMHSSWCKRTFFMYSFA